MPYSARYTKQLKKKVLDAIESREFFRDGYHLLIGKNHLVSFTDKGVSIYDEKIIQINPYNQVLEDTLSTFIHELLHLIFPQFREDAIRNAEYVVWESLTPTEKCQVLRAFAASAEWGE